MLQFIMGALFGASVSWLVCTTYWHKLFKKMSDLCGRAIESYKNVSNDYRNVRELHELARQVIEAQERLIKLLKARIERNKNLPALLNGGEK